MAIDLKTPEGVFVGQYTVDNQCVTIIPIGDVPTRNIIEAVTTLVQNYFMHDFYVQVGMPQAAVWMRAGFNYFEESEFGEFAECVETFSLSAEPFNLQLRETYEMPIREGRFVPKDWEYHSFRSETAKNNFPRYMRTLLLINWLVIHQLGGLNEGSVVYKDTMYDVETTLAITKRNEKFYLHAVDVTQVARFELQFQQLVSNMKKIAHGISLGGQLLVTAKEYHRNVVQKGFMPMEGQSITLVAGGGTLDPYQAFLGDVDGYAEKVQGYSVSYTFGARIASALVRKLSSQTDIVVL